MAAARETSDDAPLVALRRAGIAESIHRGRYVFCDPSGEITDAVGDSEGICFPRSYLKPFQAMPLVLSGAADSFGLTDAELAVACGSHRGEEDHISAVASILQKAGLSEDDLDNGAHPPMHGPAAEELIINGEAPRRIHGNCSGKHAGMLAVCVKMGWETEGYRNPDHMLQRWISSVLIEVCAVPPSELHVGVDGCGAPAFTMPLRSLATGFARLATGEGLDENLSKAALRLRDAMLANPHMISGTDGFDTEVMEKTNLVVKGGADGVWAAGSPTDGFGFALKVSDGAQRAVRPAAYAALASRGINAGDPVVTVRDLHGEEVGTLEPLRGEGRG